jgi:hypothetical protein
MSRVGLALLIFLAAYIALAQPGLCPCWLMHDVRTYHPHPFAHPERPHPHDYLLEIFSAETAAVSPPAPMPVLTLILLLALGSLWWRTDSSRVPLARWAAPPATPPPRLSASSN